MENTQPILNSSSSTLASVGGADEQHARPDSNVIASVRVNGGRRGGKRGLSKRSRGGQGLTEIAVPALLLTANHLYGRKTASKKNEKKRVSRRRRSFGRRRFSNRR
jgi:hypothetical protein